MGSKPAQRRTNQREAIREVFRHEDRPLTINEILEAGRRRVLSLNQATVYRNVKMLVETGWLRKINPPEMGTFYECALKQHHHHFRCRSCDRVYELPGCALTKPIHLPPGFVTEEHEIFLSGLCSACSA
jgi:Fur family transcriptional regulator, ferric uptake regulator